ncbi:hypothetical protein ACFQX6_65355 [Streptosporangium lutulentum]
MSAEDGAPWVRTLASGARTIWGTATSPDRVTISYGTPRSGIFPEAADPRRRPRR